MKSLLTTAIFNCFKTRAKAFDDIKMRFDGQKQNRREQQKDNSRGVDGKPDWETYAVSKNKEEFFRC